LDPNLNHTPGGEDSGSNGSLQPADPPLSEDIFDENGALTREFLLKRGTCCGNKCRNCPYDWVAVPE